MPPLRNQVSDIDYSGTSLFWTSMGRLIKSVPIKEGVLISGGSFAQFFYVAEYPD